MKNVPAIGLALFLVAPGAFAATGSASAGKATFKSRCAICHGADASGNNAVAKSLGGIPDLRSKRIQALTDVEIQRVITEGRGKMPPQGNLSKSDIANLIAFIRSIAVK